MAPLFPPQFNCVTRTGWLLALDCLSMCVCVCVGLSWVFAGSVMLGFETSGG